MHNSLRYRNCNPRATDRDHPSTRASAYGFHLGVIPRHQVWAESKPAGARKSFLCTRDNALEMIKQQVVVAKIFNNTIRSITVLTRAADLLWPYQHRIGRGGRYRR